VTGELVLPGLIDTHAHVYQYVTGRFRRERRHRGRPIRGHNPGRSGRPVLHDLAGFSGISSPRERNREPMLFLSAYLVGGLEGHYYPNLYSPDGVDIDATVKAANANRDLVSRHQGSCRDRRLCALGHPGDRDGGRDRSSRRPSGLCAFGQLWGLPESGTNGEDVDTILTRVIPLLRAGDVLAQSVHAPPRRLRQSRRRSASGDPGGA